METHVIKKERSTFIDLFLRTIAVLGLIAVLLLGAWGIIQLAVAIPSLFSNIGGGASSLFTNTNSQKELLAVSAPATITSGQTVQLSWTHKNPQSGVQYSYAISYACQSGLSLGAPVPTGAYQPVTCNTPFNYVNATQHMTVIPVVTGTASVPLVFTVTATKLSTGVIVASGTSSTMVAPGSSPTKPATTVSKPTTVKKPTSTTYYPAATRSQLYGYADLATQIIAVTPNGTRTTVQFVITNIGTNSVNSGWTFNASLPINGGYTFASQAQQALYPGDKIVYNLAFDNNFGTNSQTQYNNQYNNGYGYSTGGSYQAGGYTCNGYNCTGSNVYNNVCVNGSCNTGYNYNTGYNNIGTVSITADPLNYIIETNKANNSVSATTPIY